MSRREEGYFKILGKKEDVKYIVDLVLSIDFDTDDMEILPENEFGNKDNLISFDYPCGYGYSWENLQEYLTELSNDYEVEIISYTMIEYGEYYFELTYKNGELVHQNNKKDVEDKEFDKFLVV